MALENYLAQLEKLCHSLEAQLLLADSRLVGVAGDLGVEVTNFGELVGGDDRADIEPPPPDNVIFVQFSSGTTGDPRGAELTGKAIHAQVDALAERERADPERDIGGTWLPMSHDMGFFGSFLTRWYLGVSGFRSPPERFLRQPETWLEDCAEFGATLTSAPPFALALAARAERLRPSDSKLSLRTCVVGAERIDWSLLNSAVQILERRGLDLEVITPGYGLAEATLAVTLGDLDAPPRYVDVDEQRVVSCGTPLSSIDVRIDESSGEIVVSGPTLAVGYHRNPEATEERFRDGELWTRDLGLIKDGELYVLGRTDDVVIVGGRNIHARDVESALNAERGVRTGNCAIVDVPGQRGTSITLVAELDGAVDTSELSIRLRRASIEAAGIPIDRFVFLPKGRFPKTPSGKAQRYRCRAIAENPDPATEVIDFRNRRGGETQ
jgi:acyl-CoA synthetase (AMP-forming)/AMP-acid ligase II